MRQQARLLACDHYHVILTLPDELRGLWLANGTVLPQRLFATAWETLDELLRDAQYLGARVGSIAALQTWSQTLVFHPHLHGLVTGGGLTDDGQWRVVQNGFLLPVRVVMAGFRGKRRAALRQSVARGQLTLPEGRSRQQREKLLNKLGRTKWNVHIRERYRHGEGVRTYRARYLRGGPRSNTRLLSCANGEGQFWYRLKGAGAGERRRGVMTLPIRQFIGRYLRPVPAPGSRLVRSYGL